MSSAATWVAWREHGSGYGLRSMDRLMATSEQQSVVPQLHAEFEGLLGRPRLTASGVLSSSMRTMIATRSCARFEGKGSSGAPAMEVTRGYFDHTSCTGPQPSAIGHRDRKLNIWQMGRLPR